MACASNVTDVHILDLPEEIVETALSFLSYHETSEARAVCKVFNRICKRQLNKGIKNAEKLHGQIQKEVKNLLPRRDSERRNHYLARHVDILSSLETRLSLLGMTYHKYIDLDLCCFIPGKVLDELMSIFKTLKLPQQPPRPHEFLQELRDISCMAMEHFDEKIAPGLKMRIPPVTPLSLSYPLSESYACVSTSTVDVAPPEPRQAVSVGQTLAKFVTQQRLHTSTTQQNKRDLIELKAGFVNQRKKIVEQEKKLIEQEQRYVSQNAVIAELEKKMNDLNQQLIDISAELLKSKAEKEHKEASTSDVPVVNDPKLPVKGDNSKTNFEENPKRSLRRTSKRKATGPSQQSTKKVKC